MRTEAELLGTIDKLRRAFAEYGQHEIDCPIHPRFHGFYITYRCDCGFKQVVSQLRADDGASALIPEEG